MVRLPVPLVLVLSSLFIFPSHSHPIAIPEVGLELGIVKRSYSSDFDALYQGNQAFRKEDPELLKDLAEHGQHPPFLLFGCSDSRANDGTIFRAQPGTIFTGRSIANQYSDGDLNAHSVLAYGVEELEVKHIIVLGHYGCGGVAAAISTPPKAPWDDGMSAIQEWISPIRAVYQNSERPEITALRKENEGKTEVPAPQLHDPGFRALVEENIKSAVQTIAATKIVTESYRNETGKAHEFFIHGWVYDIENGEVKNLNVSVGPPGQAIPIAPFALVSASIQGLQHSH